jgi:hypothetical protein
MIIYFLWLRCVKHMERGLLVPSALLSEETSVLPSLEGGWWPQMTEQYLELICCSITPLADKSRKLPSAVSIHTGEDQRNSGLIFCSPKICFSKSH